MLKLKIDKDKNTITLSRNKRGGTTYIIRYELNPKISGEVCKDCAFCDRDEICTGYDKNIVGLKDEKYSTLFCDVIYYKLFKPYEGSGLYFTKK